MVINLNELANQIRAINVSRDRNTITTSYIISRGSQLEVLLDRIVYILETVKLTDDDRLKRDIKSNT